MKKKIFGGFPGGRFIGKEELKAVRDVVKSRSPYRFYGLNLKNKTEKLEKLCCKVFRRRFALAVSSGTAALHTALYSLGVTKGDEVIIPAYGWVANLMSVLGLGARPVIVPIDETLGIDTTFLEKSITKKTRAIVAVHMRGYPCDMDRIQKIGRKHNIPIIEDAAQCIGGRIGRLPAGACGDISILSFQYNKLITCGEGGVVLTNKKGLYQKTYRFHDLGMSRRAGGKDPEGLKSIGSFGLNYRISELQSTLLIEQIKKMPAILKALKRSHKKALAVLAPVRQKFRLAERRPAISNRPNNAFLCLTAETQKDAHRAYKALKRINKGFQMCSRLDNHNFKVWKDYMKRGKLSFRLTAGRETEKILDKSIFIEVNALP